MAIREHWFELEREDIRNGWVQHGDTRYTSKKGAQDSKDWFENEDGEILRIVKVTPLYDIEVVG